MPHFESNRYLTIVRATDAIGGIGNRDCKCKTVNPGQDFAHHEFGPRPSSHAPRAQAVSSRDEAGLKPLRRGRPTTTTCAKWNCPSGKDDADPAQVSTAPDWTILPGTVTPALTMSKPPTRG
ncbi:hypothetical protein FJTKL_09075 [Diaporthe vaccinii]|uniref:Uncharacterized protein n=1 Tax=Diaporthe vaccinii TaxID=105482 RepID=A0ABR4EPK8_9PEZI